MNVKSTELAHVAVRNSRRLVGRVQASRVEVDGVAPVAVMKAIKKAGVGRPSEAERGWIKRVELMRALLLRSTAPLTLVDFGAGTSHRFDSGEKDTENTVVRTLGDMAKSSKPPRWAYLLFRLVRELQPESVLELGACVGISASYQAAALELNGRGRLLSLEGADALAARSRQTLVDLELGDRGDVRLGRFADSLPKAIVDFEPIGLAFVDGHHVESATLGYMESLLPAMADESVLVFDDINWSEGMRNAWTRIATDERFALTVDMRSVGLAVVSKSAKTRHRTAISYY
jgi:predicted O-methyltransferase YrrM